MAKQVGKFSALEPCVICGFEGRGFGFQLHLSPLHAYYDFCSKLCQGVGQRLAELNQGKIEGPMLSDIEQRAIVDARQQLAEALERQKVMDAFMNLSPDQIDDIIRSVIIGFQASVQRAYGRGEVPF